MPASELPATLEPKIEAWRAFLRRVGDHAAAAETAHQAADPVALESRLRAELERLHSAGLSDDEAFQVALTRLAAEDDATRRFAQRETQAQWAAAARGAGTANAERSRREPWMVFALAVAAAAITKLTMLLGPEVDAPGSDWFYARNASFFVLPLLAGFFAWKRQLARPLIGALAVVFVAAGVFINVFPFVRESDVAALAALHLPMLLWIAVGVAYAGERWRTVDGRMDFIRFSGEMFIYFVLIALGGGVLMGVNAMLFEAIGLDFEPFMETWVLPAAVPGAVVVAAGLVESRQRVMESMAPLLTRLFTPLFALALLGFLTVLVVTGRGVNIERNLLIGFDLLLALVVALLLFSISARDPQQPPGAFDAVQLVLVLSALLVDLVALSAVASRISEFGFTPNRVAALGENLILLANLAGAAVLSWRFLRGTGDLRAMERWQTAFVPVYAAWALVVVAGFPLLFP